LRYWLWHKVVLPAVPIFTIIGGVSGIPTLLMFWYFITQ
jgi:hypothetical protein